MSEYFDPKDLAGKLAVNVLINVLTALIAPHVLGSLLKVRVERLNWKIYLLLLTVVAGLLVGVYFLVAYIKSKNKERTEAEAEVTTF